MTYTLDISNPGLHDASNVSIQDTLPTGTCYVDGSTAVLSDGWSLAEPTIISNTPDCTETTQQILVWNLSGSNALTNTITNEIAYLSAQSETVQVSYQVLVTEGMQSGTNIVNDASVGTTNPEDDNNPNQDSSQTTIPYPNLVVSTS
ncbi:MAG: DUF11 domain-containing protein [Candidatus Peribacteria bacterium]|nr:MAG: DUF11 domain-containing protein [Candidatus Peribacteria bacterium]